MRVSLAFYFVSCLFLAPCLYAADNRMVHVDNGLNSIVIGSSVDYFEDKTRDLTFSDIVKSDKNFIPSKVSLLSFSYTDSVFWVRFSINLTEAVSKTVILEIAYPLFDRIDFYAIAPEGQIKEKKIGNQIPYSQREIAHRAFAIPIQLNPGVNQIFMRFETPGFMNIPLVLWSPEVFHERTKKEYLAFGTYIGVVFVLLVLCIHTYRTTQEKGYLTLSAVMVNYLMWLGTILGFSIQFLGQDHTEIVKRVFLVFCFGVSLFELLFLRSFLGVHNKYRRIDQVLKSCLILPILGCLCIPFLQYRFLIEAAATFAVGSFFIEVLIGGILAARKYAPAYYYLSAKIVMQLATSSNIFISFKLFDYGLSVPWLMVAASAFEGVLFLLATTGKVNISQKERSQFEALQKEYETYKEKYSFFTQVAHDIRSPILALNFVRDSLDTLDENTRVLLRSAIDRINSIVNSILVKRDHCEKNNSTLGERKAVSLASLLDIMVAEKKIENRNRDYIDLRLNLHQKIYNLFVFVNETELKRAISNLINNSIEAIEEKGLVRINLSRDEQKVVISIYDNGKGIPEDVLKRLGTKGFTYGKENGNGLGVHGAKTIIESYDGQISYQSKPEQGTLLKIILPRHQEPSWFIKSIELEEGQFIIILDDDETIHQIWKQRFEQFKAQCLQIHHFYRGEDLIQWRVNNPSKEAEIFLVDFELIGDSKTGLDIILELGISDKSIIISSHYYNDHIHAKCIENGVGLIPKNLALLVPIQVASKRYRPGIIF